MGGALAIGGVVALIAVSWLCYTIVNNVFDKGENALKKRRQVSETERIRQQIQAQRRNSGQLNPGPSKHVFRRWRRLVGQCLGGMVLVNGWANRGLADDQRCLDRAGLDDRQR